MFTFEQLTGWLGVQSGCTINKQKEYRSLETDSRLVTAETVFIALPGVSSHGWDYLDQVAARGATVAIVPKGKGIVSNALTLIEVEEIESCLAMLARHVYGPIPKHIVAVTGTNGKSSICYYTAQLAQTLGMSSAMIGTFGIGLIGKLHDAKQTTPDLLTMHKLLSEFAKQGVELVAFEASSHALDQQRLAGIPVSTAIFSNLTRDHLDYHGTMESYARAKQKLFEFDSLTRSIICSDSDYSDFMAQACVSPVWFYSSKNALNSDFKSSHPRFHQTGVSFRLQATQGHYDVNLPLLGEFNIQNALAAIAALTAITNDESRVVRAAETLLGAPGRMEAVKRVNAPLILVDYAHTSDALSVALQAIHAHSAGKVICVFGCGGDRDRGKRPLMLQVAQQNADLVWLTSDNPRTEPPEVILQDALVALDVKGPKVQVEIDRRVAIQKAVSQASPQDIILIAGKGHETYQEIQGVRHHFDDREEALEALKQYVPKH